MVPLAASFPSTTILWFLLIGVMLVGVGTIGHALSKIWLSTSTVYLVVGLLIGTGGLGLLAVDFVENAKFLEHLTEVAVVISLYGVGLKMRMPLRDRRWIGPVVLASVTMTATVGLVAAIGFWGLGLGIGAAVLLGAVMAPTDPVLASAVQVNDPDDQDRLRQLLTGEAGLNDGSAFPFVLLGVGLAVPAEHALGAYGWKWLTVDVLWKVGAALPLGWYAGCLMGRVSVWVRRRCGGAAGSDEMLAMGLIALVYGLSLLIHAYAFLSVFAAAVALRRFEMEKTQADTAAEAEEASRQHDHEPAGIASDDPAELAKEQLYAADALERLAEIVLVVLVGAAMSHAVLSGTIFGWPGIWAFAFACLLLVRPIAVVTTLHGCGIAWPHRLLAAWFGIRGIGTLYYLTHAFNLGVADAEPEAARRLADLALATVALSIVLHGVTATPLLAWYSRHRDATPKPAQP